ncbi:aspartate carbamoyltransferase catalytic subunit [Silvibacterium sp.]|uniref:aspartate carbamoyltransferase catalytic subunit n=1 Tax=Silvibacterium sp. TaxID=1964179 RepID=UPI0039E625DF
MPTLRESGKSAAVRPTAAEPLTSPVKENHVAAGSVLQVGDLSLEDVGAILALADELESQDAIERADRLYKRRVSLLFYESSTRTRTSFELAAKALGADTSLVSAQSSSIEKGESLKDTGITLKALGAECIILRSPYSGSAQLLADVTGLPVLNAGDGMHEHPSQGLLDLRTILRALGKSGEPVTDKLLEGVTVTICGDIFHSRVARSNALLLPRLGARVLLCGPTQLLPETAASIGPGITIERDFEKALDQSQIVMMLRIQAERLAGLSIDLEEYKSRYQANAERIAAHAPKAVIMHPGPMIRGLEITSSVADGPQSVIAEQVHHGLAIRMALIARALPPRESKSVSKAETKVAAKAAKAPAKTAAKKKGRAE